jgi:hypothetical protein
MHPYLRSYLAGIALPTMLLPLVLAGLLLFHPTGHTFRVEEVAIFPMGLVPNAWGLWNMLYVRLRRTREIPAGAYGALLLLVLVPLAYAVQLGLGKVLWTPGTFALGFPVAFVAYYVAWKTVVSRLNDLLGIG